MMQNMYCTDRYMWLFLPPPSWKYVFWIPQGIFTCVWLFLKCLCVGLYVCVFVLHLVCVCVCQTGSLAGGVTAVGSEGVHGPSRESGWTCVYCEETVQQDRTHSWKRHTPTRTRTSYTSYTSAHKEALRSRTSTCFNRAELTRKLSLSHVRCTTKPTRTVTVKHFGLYSHLEECKMI